MGLLGWSGWLNGGKSSLGGSGLTLGGLPLMGLFEDVSFMVKVK